MLDKETGPQLLCKIREHQRLIVPVEFLLEAVLEWSHLGCWFEHGGHILECSRREEHAPDVMVLGD